MEWETVIGLEVHVQLATQSKIFSGAATAYGAEPNTQACAIDLGLPGALPVLNERVVTMAVKFGLSVNADIARHSVFARKNYFYPDLPKGYQISQDKYPIVGQGKLTVQMEDGSERTIGITRAHLEEDAGKSLHDAQPGCTGIDLNRASIPLLEIVSEPDMRSAKEAVAYLKTIHELVRYLEISDANMQEGSLRCDVNISLRPKGQKEFGTRAEIKNVNSFRFVEHAILYEMDRQKDLLESGEKVMQETRLYDAKKDVTRSMRLKEEAHDYRYFPDPDLLPVAIDDAFINEVRSSLPELPWQKRHRFQTEYKLNPYDAKYLTSSRELGHYFEATLGQESGATAKNIANWIASDLAAALNKHNLTITESPITPEQLAGLMHAITDGIISNNIAKQVFTIMWEQGGEAEAIIEREGLRQITDDNAIAAIIDEIMAANPNQLQQYREGKDKLFGYFVGQTMKATKGKANPKQVNDLLRKKLKG